MWKDGVPPPEHPYMTILAEEKQVPVAARPGFVKLQEVVKGIDDESVGWDNAWKEDITPWNAGEFQPPLKELITSKVLDLPPSGRALVPGCGRGYETALIATLLRWDAVGVDISPKAIEVAKGIHGGSPIEPPGKVTFKTLDFFKHTVPGDERYDVIFDYLFFEAICPSKRGDWASQVNALIKPGGYLIALIYPIDPETNLGPPYFVRPKHFAERLGEGWTKVFDAVPATSLASHVGRERLAVWKKDA